MQQMDSGVILMVVSTAILIFAVFAWAWGRKRLSPEVVTILTEGVARLRAHLGAADSERIIRLYAGELYDVMKIDSAKVSREFFVDWMVRAILGAQPKGSEDAETFGAMAVER
jgi:hypothetical protein